MATTPEGEFDKRTHVGEEAKRILDQMRPMATGTRAVSWRTFILLMAVGAALVLGPMFPWMSVVGSLALLAYIIGLR